MATRNLHALKASPELIRFYIRQKFGADIPVNAKLESYQQGDDQHHKIEKYLKGKNREDEDEVFLAHLYDDFMHELDGVRYSDVKIDKSKIPPSQTRTRITDMLNVTNRYKH